MTRRSRLALLLYLPAFLLVFAGVRAVWLTYLDTLSESEHHRVLEHSTVGALAIWAACFVLALLLALGVARLVDRHLGRK